MTNTHKNLTRMIALLVTAVMLIIPCTTAASALEIPDYIPDEYYALADEIADAAETCEPFVPLGEDGIPRSDVELLMSIVLNEHPELFHLSHSYSYSYDMGADVALAVNLKYKMTEEEFVKASAELNDWLTSIVELADPDFTELEYALFFHDYLCSNYEYDTTYTIRDAYNFMKNGRGVCQAYTYAYMLLLKAVEIETSFASSGEMNHIWNLVKIDGEWYHADATWDDPVGGVPGIAKHGFFLLSDSAISTEDKGHYGWISPHACTQTKYDGSALNQADSSYAYNDGYWYFMKDGHLWRTEDPAKQGEIFMEMHLHWKVWESTSRYTNTYSALIAREGKLYMNTPETVIEVDPGTKSTRELYKHTAGDGYIYGFVLDMGKDCTAGAGTGEVKLNISQKPNVAGYSVSVWLYGIGNGELVASGDANGDGKLNLSDASLMLKYIAAWDVTVDTEAADVDGNGRINLTDVSKILRAIAR